MAGATGAQSHVFVSYSRSNKEVMRRVVQTLRQSNIPVWTDERLTAGTSSWKNAIERALQGAFCIVVLMSPTAKTSEWVERELDYAYVLQRPVYPILVEGSQRDAVPFELINMQYIDVRTDFDQGMKHLIGLLSPYAIVPSTAKSAIDADGPPPESQHMPLIVPESVSSVISTPPSIPDMLMFSLGLNPEDSGNIARYAARNRRILGWYFLEPRKFRLFSALTQDSTARLIHASVTMIAVFWVWGSVLLLQWLLANTSGLRSSVDLFLFAIIGYGVVVLVPMSTPYRTRRAFFGPILYAVLLLGLMAGLVWIAYHMITSLNFLLEIG